MSGAVLRNSDRAIVVLKVLRNINEIMSNFLRLWKPTASVHRFDR